jgi:hypothetical protein
VPVGCAEVEGFVEDSYHLRHSNASWPTAQWPSIEHSVEQTEVLEQPLDQVYYELIAVEATQVVHQE